MYYMKNIEINQQKEKPLFRGKVANLDRFLFLGSTQEDERGEQDDSHQRQSDVFGRKLKTEMLFQIVADERPRVSCLGIVLRTKRVLQRDEWTAQKDQLRDDGARQHNCVVSLVPLVLHRENDSPKKQGSPNPMEPEDEVSEDAIDFHGSPPGFDCEMCYYRATIARFLTVANIAYTSLKVKLNRKSPYFRAFSGFPYWIKKFSSPKIKIWFEPNFFRAETERMNQPRHRLAEPRRTPKKNVPCFSDLRATNFF